MNQHQVTTQTITLEENLLDSVVAATVAIHHQVADYRPQPLTEYHRPTFITDKQKQYITVLRDQAKAKGLHTLAAKKVVNRSEASDYIKELIAAIKAVKPKPKPMIAHKH